MMQVCIKMIFLYSGTDIAITVGSVDSYGGVYTDRIAKFAHVSIGHTLSRYNSFNTQWKKKLNPHVNIFMVHFY